MRRPQVRHERWGIRAARSDLRQAGERSLDLLERVLEVLEAAVEVPLIGGQVEMTMTTQVEQDDARFAGLLGGKGFVHRDADRMGRLRRREDPLGASEGHAGLEAGALVDASRLDVAMVLEQADERRHPVIAETTGVDRLRDEIVAE